MHNIIYDCIFVQNSVVSGFLKKLNHEDENILENDDGKGIHKNVWSSLLEKVESLNDTLDSTTFNRLIKSVRFDIPITRTYLFSGSKIIFLRCTYNAGCTYLM